jgi:hypothetical protein
VQKKISFSGELVAARVACFWIMSSLASLSKFANDELLVGEDMEVAIPF